MSMKEESKKKKVIIKWRAYVKMMKHVLRFGSLVKEKSQFKEVMGVIMGKNGTEPGIIKTVYVEDVIPISHGGHVEVAFKPEDYVSFSVVDSQFAEKGIFAVGWYHSHPGLTCFFSAVDIRNQLGWQTSNPSAIGIVWDHQRLADDNDMGFDVYRLDDPAKGPMSEFHEVQWIVEPPEDVGFFREGIVDIITNVSKGEPPILEINEVPDVFGDLTVPGTAAMMAKEPEISYVQVVESLKSGIDKMADVFIQPLIRYLNEWAKGMSQGIINKNVVMLTNIKGLKENLSKTMAELQSWFKFALNDQLRNVDVFIDDKFEFNGEQRKKLSAKLDEVSASLNKNLSNAFDAAIGKVVADITTQVSEATVKLKKVAEVSNEISGTMSSQKATMEAALNTYKQKVGEIKTNSLLIASDSSKTLKQGLDPIVSSIDELQKKLNDIKLSVKALNGMVK